MKRKKNAKNFSLQGKNYNNLKAKYEKLVGELAMRKRDKYGKCNEKPKASTSSDGGTDKTKDEDEQDYIENGSNNDVPPVEDPEEEEASSFKMVTEGRCDYELIAQEALG